MKHEERLIGEQGLAVEITYPESFTQELTLILLHGAWAGSWTWANYVEYFVGQGFRCAALNFRGHYRSRPLDLTDVGFMDYVADVRTVVEALRAPFVLIGHSMGGSVAQKYIEQYDDAAGAVLIDSNPPYEVRAQLFPDETPPEQLEAIPPLVPPPIEMFKAITWDVDDHWLAIAAEKLQPESGKAYRELGPRPLSGRCGFHIDPRRVNCPVLVIGSSTDGEGRPVEGYFQDRLAQFYGAEHLDLPGISHAGFLVGEQWQRCAEAIVDWIRRRIK